MITARLRALDPPNDPEDIFASSLLSLFPDAHVSSHGDPGSSLIYTSPTHGDVHLNIPAHPNQESGRELFAHYLWNAACVVADLVETAAGSGGTWDVREQKVLEVGAGTALPSILCALSSAAECAITDHPSSPALTTRAIQSAVTRNLPSSRTTTLVSIQSHEWGDLDGSVFARSHEGYFSRMIVADCLWMRRQHMNLVRSILHFLGPTRHEDVAGGEGAAPNTPKAYVVAGFHTGRAIVADFFAIAAEAGLICGKGEEMYELDVKSSEKRVWEAVRQGESKEEARRWVVVAVLARE